MKSFVSQRLKKQKANQKVENQPTTKLIVVTTFPFASYSVIHLNISMCVLIQFSAKSAIKGFGKFSSRSQRERDTE